MFIEVSLVICALLLLVIYWLGDKIPKLHLDGAHVVITGGSSGIGLSLAKHLAQRGCHISIIARDKKKLEEAAIKIKTFGNEKSEIQALSADVSNSDQIAKCIEQVAKKHGNKIDVLVLSAGVTNPTKFEDQSVADIEKLNAINYLGCVYATKAALPFMKHEKPSRIVYVSSLAGLIGVVGYSTYSPTKFALRGLAEALHQELRPYNIACSLAVPADVDTPMYMEEQKIKCEECKLVSEGSGVFTADQVSKSIINGIINWRFFITTGFDSAAAATLTSGLSPGNFSEILFQFFAIPLFRLVGLQSRKAADKIVMKVYQKNKNK